MELPGAAMCAAMCSGGGFPNSAAIWVQGRSKNITFNNIGTPHLAYVCGVRQRIKRERGKERKERPFPQL
jgi:hypothetical protein